MVARSGRQRRTKACARGTRKNAGHFLRGPAPLCGARAAETLGTLAASLRDRVVYPEGRGQHYGDGGATPTTGGGSRAARRRRPRRYRRTMARSVDADGGAPTVPSTPSSLPRREPPWLE